MVETLSRQGRVDHLVPELASELVPSYSRLVEAEVPEVLARRLVRHVADSLEADQIGDPTAIRRGALRGGRRMRPDRPADPRPSREPAGSWPWSGRPEWEDDDGRQAGGELQARAWPAGRPGHGGHLPDRGG